MILDEVGTYVATTVTSTTLTLGTNLFLGRLPDDPDTCVAIFETGGTLPEHTMGGASVPAVERPRIQIVTRAPGYSAARSLAKDIWDALEGVADESLSGKRYLRISAIQSPFPLERDTSERIIVIQNFEVLKTP